MSVSVFSKGVENEEVALSAIALDSHGQRTRWVRSARTWCWSRTCAAPREGKGNKMCGVREDVLLFEDAPLFPVIEDAAGVVLSLPP